MKEMWTAVATMVGMLAFFQSFLRAILPRDLRQALREVVERLFLSFSSYCHFEITEIDGVNTNELYNAVQLYLSTRASVSGTRLSLSRQLNSCAFTFGLSNNGRLVDSFGGATATWEHSVSQWNSQSFSYRPVPQEKRVFTLRVNKKDKPLFLRAYLDHIMIKAEEIRRQSQERLLYTNHRGLINLDNRGHPWESVPFKHPSTFHTLAMEPERKEAIMADLKDFAGGEAFYQNTGRAWKRGYLLYGQPGTGKSSLIAAMANYLGYDIYDLELTEVNTNSELRKLLMKTTSKSIVVIEDIDCSVHLMNRKKKKKNSNVLEGFDPIMEESDKSFTLSGLLNFTDGIWSCCGSERIFVFTTNHIEKLDPALLRSGRMDMHIFMSYCSFPALKILMKNYWGFEAARAGAEETEMLSELEGVMEKAEMTPADVSEILIKNKRKEKLQAMAELLGILRGRVERKKAMEEEEEQEKRALESPKQGEDDNVHKCNRTNAEGN